MLAHGTTHVLGNLSTKLPNLRVKINSDQWLEIHKIYQNLPPPPKTNMSPKRDYFSIGNRSSNHCFSGAMLVLGRVYESMISSLTYHLSIPTHHLPGIQNGITRRCLSLPICTTHFTGYLTDVGTGLGLWARETLNGNNPPTLLKAEGEG